MIEHHDEPARAANGRRDFLKKGAIAGAVAWTIPVITSVPAMAQSSVPGVGALFGISGDGSLTPRTVFSVDLATAALTLVITPTNSSNDGETIAAQGGLLYRLSGISDGLRQFQSIDPVVPSATDINSPVGSSEATSLVWEAGSGTFKFHNLLGQFWSITLTGTPTMLNAATGLTQVRGMGFVGSTLLAVDATSAALLTIDPATGASTASVGITESGNAIIGANGLTVDPMTGTVYLVYRFDAVRRLGTVDPATGIITPIGVLSQNLAGLAWL